MQLVSGTVEALLRAGATPEGRKELAERTGIGDEYILDWVNRADLMRVRELHDPSRRREEYSQGQRPPAGESRGGYRDRIGPAQPGQSSQETARGKRREAVGPTTAFVNCTSHVNYTTHLGHGHPLGGAGQGAATGGFILTGKSDRQRRVLPNLIYPGQELRIPS